MNTNIETLHQTPAVTPAQPQGPTQSKWHRAGYQEGMADIRALILQGADVERIAEWVRNNM